MTPPVLSIELIIACFMVASVAVGITVWVQSTFQTKEHARHFEERMEQGMQNIWTQITETQTKITTIAENVSYIKGRVEPPLQPPPYR